MTTQAPAEELVLDELSAGVLRIVLNNPKAANALGPEQRNRIIEVLKRADTDPAVRVVVITSTGKHFCSGANVGGVGSGGTEMRVGDVTRRIMDGAQQLIAAVLDCGKPVIAGVQGTAAGMGAHLAFASDLVVAAESASFIEAFILRGLVVDAGGAYLLPRRIGLQKAKELAFFGDRLPAEEALALGLVNRVVPADQLRTAVDEFALRLTAAPTSAITLTKKLFNRSLDGDRDESFLLEGMSQEMQSHAHDSSEGVKAFFERRAPQFRGC
jgi:2-(1,2-epoxy-1,2-dihydrophenyl)acetyl-CoA isomerase